MTQIPDRSAGPEQVRTYIRQTLTSKHKTEENFADEAARCWRLGRGSELHDATLEYLQKVLGVDIGLCLYNSVREDKEDAWEQSYIGFICNCQILSQMCIVSYRRINSYNRDTLRLRCVLTLVSYNIFLGTSTKL